MELKQWHGFCLCPLGGACPPDAVPADAPFSPLVFLVRRDPLRSRGLFAVTVLDEVFEAETAGVLLPPAQGTTPAEPLREFVAANGACVLNTAFSAAFSVLERWNRERTEPLRVTLVGLGDVGGTLLLALKLLGRELGELRIYDPNAAQCRRYELELNQVLPLDHPLPPVTVCTEDTLFDCDLLLFTASRGVPPVGSGVADVRLAQYEKTAPCCAAMQPWRAKRTLPVCSARSPTPSIRWPAPFSAKATATPPGNLTAAACCRSRCRASASA